MYEATNGDLSFAIFDVTNCNIKHPYKFFIIYSVIMVYI